MVRYSRWSHAPLLNELSICPLSQIVLKKKHSLKNFKKKFYYIEKIISAI